jgi:DNA-binding CsgD family transcriptional regulator
MDANRVRDAAAVEVRKHRRLFRSGRDDRVLSALMLPLLRVVLYDLPVAVDFGATLKSRPAKAVASWVSRFVSRHAAPDFALRAAVRGSEQGSPPDFGLPYRWAPERQARVGVLPREGTAADIRWFEVQPWAEAVRRAARGKTVLAPSVADRLIRWVRQPAPVTLSAREVEVLALVAKGKTNAEIASSLYISEATVKTHLLRAFNKLEVSDRTAAVITAMSLGLLG